MVLTEEPLQTAMWTSDENGFRNLAIPHLRFQQLDEDKRRFFVLQPAVDQAFHMRCHLNVSALFNAPPFVAVKNARGYRLLEDPIEVDGRGIIISTTLERFFKHYRSTINENTRLW